LPIQHLPYSYLHYPSKDYLLDILYPNAHAHHNDYNMYIFSMHYLFWLFLLLFSNEWWSNWTSKTKIWPLLRNFYKLSFELIVVKKWCCISSTLIFYKSSFQLGFFLQQL
jgi:hypothetical protein